MSKKVVGIVMGGYSSEREISIESGTTVYQNLPQREWDCFKIIVDLNQWKVVDHQENIFPLNLDNFTFKIGEKTVHFDVVFNAIHGAPGEDGQLAEMLSSLKIPHTSCSRSTAELTFDKRNCLEKVKEWGIPVANSFAFDCGDLINIDTIVQKVGLPCFVKPNRSGSSYGVVKVY